jgi:hypothetical protein
MRRGSEKPGTYSKRLKKTTHVRVCVCMCVCVREDHARACCGIVLTCVRDSDHRLGLCVCYAHVTVCDPVGACNLVCVCDPVGAYSLVCVFNQTGLSGT